MSERQSAKHETREKEERPRSEGAIRAALTGFAPDGGSWMSGRQVFDHLTENGHSLNEALDVAVDTARSAGDDKTESTPTEAKVRFWDNMDPDQQEGEAPKPAIERALTGYAKDGGTWLKARGLFYEAIEKDMPLEDALDAALETAAGGSETHPEVAKDRFYGGVDPDYADKDHYMGRKNGIRISEGSAKIEIGFGRSAEEKRQRRLGSLAARHRRS